jgi:hypothetical protein
MTLCFVLAAATTGALEGSGNHWLPHCTSKFPSTSLREAAAAVLVS